MSDTTGISTHGLIVGTLVDLREAQSIPALSHFWAGGSQFAAEHGAPLPSSGVDPSMSAFGPKAYLAQLLKVAKKVEFDTTDKGWDLFTRRPDLKPESGQALPKIDTAPKTVVNIVNDILCKKITESSLLFNEDVAKAIAIFKHFGVELAEIYEALPSLDHRTRADRLRLGLSSKDIDLSSETGAWAKLIGASDAELSAFIERVKTQNSNVGNLATANWQRLLANTARICAATGLSANHILHIDGEWKNEGLARALKLTGEEVQILRGLIPSEVGNGNNSVVVANFERLVVLCDITRWMRELGLKAKDLEICASEKPPQDSPALSPIQQVELLEHIKAAISELRDSSASKTLTSADLVEEIHAKLTFTDEASTRDLFCKGIVGVDAIISCLKFNSEHQGLLPRLVSTLVACLGKIFHKCNGQVCAALIFVLCKDGISIIHDLLPTPNMAVGSKKLSASLSALAHALFVMDCLKLKPSTLSLVVDRHKTVTPGSSEGTRSGAGDQNASFSLKKLRSISALDQLARLSRANEAEIFGLLNCENRGKALAENLGLDLKDGTAFFAAFTQLKPETAESLTILLKLSKATGLSLATLLADVKGEVATAKRFADDCQSQLKAKLGYGAESVLREIDLVVANQRRAAMVANILQKKEKCKETVDQLSEYLLIDVQSAGTLTASPLDMAIASVQLFLQQAQMGIRGTVTGVDDEDWTWLRSFDAWKKRRQQFYYADRAITPFARQFASDIFKQLRDELAQAPIRPETVQKALANYLHDLETDARLIHCAACLAEVPEQGGHPARIDLVLIGRTKTSPRAFYIRRWEGMCAWTPWEKIPLTISTDEVSPVHAFGRQFLFWAEESVHDSPVTKGGNSIHRSWKQADIKYSFETVHGSWCEPQTMAKDVVVDVCGTVDVEKKKEGSNEKTVTSTNINFQTKVMGGGRNALRPIAVKVDFAPTTAVIIKIDDVSLICEQAYEGYARVYPNFGKEFMWYYEDNQYGGILIHNTHHLSFCAPLGKDGLRFPDVKPLDHFIKFQGSSPLDWKIAPDTYTFKDWKFTKRALNEKGKLYSELNDSSITVSFDIKVKPNESHNSVGLLIDNSQILAVLRIMISAVSIQIKVTDTYRMRISVNKEGLMGFAKMYTLSDIPGETLLPVELIAVGFEKRIHENSSYKYYDRNEFAEEVIRAIELNHDNNGKYVAESRVVLRNNQFDSSRSLVEQRNSKILVTLNLMLKEHDKINFTDTTNFIQISVENICDDDRPFRELLSMRDGLLDASSAGENIKSIDFMDNKYECTNLTSTPAHKPFLLSQQLGVEQIRTAHYDIHSKETTFFIDVTGKTIRLRSGHFAYWNSHGGSLDAQMESLSIKQKDGGNERKSSFVSGSDVKFPSIELKGDVSKNCFVTSVDGQFGWFMAGEEHDLFLFNPKEQYFYRHFSNGYSGKTAADAPQYSILAVPCISIEKSYSSLIPDVTQSPTWQATRLGTSVIGELSQRLLAGGVDELLSLEAQSLHEKSFEDVFNVKDKKKWEPLPQKGGIDFDGAYGPYFWELFFHVPFMLATQLSAQGHFEEAKRWFEYIYDPSKKDNPWQFRPLCELAQNEGHERLRKVLEDPGRMQRWRLQPTNPDAVAAFRPLAMAKAVVFAYVDNLRKWADQEFEAGDFESVSRASNLYMLALKLIGTSAPAEIQGKGTQGKGTLAKSFSKPELDHDPAFYIPHDEAVANLRQRIESMLARIRAGLTIDGRQRLLSHLGDNGGATIAGKDAEAALSRLLPPQRFVAALAHARRMTETTMRLGNMLLSALEKRDAEQLAEIHHHHAKAVLDATVDLKDSHVKELEAANSALEEGRKSIEARKNHYGQLLGRSLSSNEIESIAAMSRGIAYSEGAGIASTVASLAHLVPQIGSPFAMTFGGLQLGPAAELAAVILGTKSGLAQSASQMYSMIAGFERRGEEWQLQKDMADAELSHLDKQIEAAKIALDIAKKDAELQKTMAAHEREIGAFITGKFTNKELYGWMAARLNSLQHQSFSLAIEAAKAAQAALIYELDMYDNNKQYIPDRAWDDARRGLLSGETLLTALDRMESAYESGNKRRLEITTVVSLKQHDHVAFENFQKNGECHFSVSEAFFDRAHPGHYARKIKSVQVSLPALVGPYQTVNATLTQTGNVIVWKPDSNAVSFLLSGKTQTSEPLSIHTNMCPNQQIALSAGTNDSGLFILSFQDERYLPFEGTGAVSNWTLSMPPKNNDIKLESVADVVVTLRYTAIAGDETFKKIVADKVAKTNKTMPFMLLDLPFSPTAKKEGVGDNVPDSYEILLNNQTIPETFRSARTFKAALIMADIDPASERLCISFDGNTSPAISLTKVQEPNGAMLFSSEGTSISFPETVGRMTLSLVGKSAKVGNDACMRLYLFGDAKVG